MLGDRDELIRVFENLVENALKYGASGKRVEVTLSVAAGEAAVSCATSAPGIAPEHLPRLTERFYRVDVEQSRGQGGTGLGLSLVKHTRHGHTHDRERARKGRDIHSPYSTGRFRNFENGSCLSSRPVIQLSSVLHRTVTADA